MKKRFVACILALSVVLSMVSVASAQETAEPAVTTQEDNTPVGYLTNCYDPN